MASKLSFISIFFWNSFLLVNCFVRNNQQQQQPLECRFHRLNALEPTSILKSEGGFTEYWNPNNQEFQCAGVAFIRHTIRPNNFLLPSLTNSPLMVVITKGKGAYGAVLPGCPETSKYGEESGLNVEDRIQNIRHFTKGDLIVFHPGIVHWVYNRGNEDLVAVVMFDTTNDINQLDNIPQRSYILGNPQAKAEEQQGQVQQFEGGNILKGFSVETLQKIYMTSQELATKLHGKWDKRGHMMRLEPEQKHHEQEGQQDRGSTNGLEETSCSQRMVQNLNDLSQVDINNPQAGHLTSLNSNDLPILRDYKLSAETGHLHRNAIMAPHWTFNAHTIIYGIDGEARIQVVNHQGESVFDEHLRQGQILVVPMNFVVVKEAGNQGFKWVAFKTNDNAMINTLVGQHSSFTGLPLNVLANILQISEREAYYLKYTRKEHLIFSPQSQSESE